jgi:uncharacterized NAD(P)/FAD-binding protein YdhS
MAYSSSTIAIVGGGASGTLVAAQLLRQTTQPLRVVLFEPAEAAGMGLAYGTSEMAHLLNVPAGRISVWPDRPSNFLDWLNSPSNCATLLQKKKFAAGDFVPRAFFARYLASALEEGIAAGREHHARFEHRREGVVDFIPFHSSGTVVTRSADTEDVAHIVLALGNLPPRDPLARSHEFFRSPRYVSRVWEEGALASIGRDDAVLVVGSGLTAIDVIISLRQLGHRGKIVVTSRNGRFPQVHAPSAPYPDFLADRPLPSSVREWMRMIRGEISKAKESDVDWRPVFDSLRPHTQAMWESLDLSERRRFLRHMRSFWESCRHRTPQASWSVIETLHRDGTLEFCPGRLQDFEENEDGVKVFLRTRKRESVELNAGWVLNCIGPESNFRQHLNDPLIINLIARGVLHPDPLFLGIDALPNGQVMGAAGTAFPQISTLGPPLRGVLWETTAIPEIRTQAQRLAQRILSGLSFPAWQI